MNESDPDPDTEALIAELEARIQARLAEVVKAEAEGRLWELAADVPSIWDQVRSIPESHFYEGGREHD